jgi:hypothetical protein
VYIGKVIAYYKKIGVAEIVLQGNDVLKINSAIIFQGSTTGSYKEKITSMEKDHQQIISATKGEKIAVKVNSPVKINDEVYLVKAINKK